MIPAHKPASFRHGGNVSVGPRPLDPTAQRMDLLGDPPPAHARRLVTEAVQDIMTEMAPHPQRHRGDAQRQRHPREDVERPPSDPLHAAILPPPAAADTAASRVKRIARNPPSSLIAGGSQRP